MPKPTPQKPNPNQLTGIPAAATQGAAEAQKKPNPQPDAKVNPDPAKTVVPKQRRRTAR